MSRLAAAELVTARRGVGGGFRLSRESAQISMLQVVEAIEGRAGLNACFLSSDRCSCHNPCGAHAAFVAVKAEMLRALESTSIAQLAANERKTARASQRCRNA